MSAFDSYLPALGYPTKSLKAKKIFIKSLLGVFGSEPLGLKLIDTVLIDLKVLQERFAEDLIKTLSDVYPMGREIYIEDNSFGFSNLNNKAINMLRDIFEELYRSRKNPTNVHHHFPKCKGGCLDTKTDDRNKPIFNVMYNEGKEKIHSNTSEINRIIHSYIHNIFGESLLREKLLYLLNNEKPVINETIYKDTLEAINDIFSGSKRGGYKPEVLDYSCNNLKESLGLTDEDIHELQNIQESFYHDICDITPLDADVRNLYVRLPIKGLFNYEKVPNVIEQLIQSTKFVGKRYFFDYISSLYDKYNGIKDIGNSRIVIPGYGIIEPGQSLISSNHL